MKLLISWLAFNNDFKDGHIDKTGPTYTFHKLFYKQDKHILLSAANSDDTRLALLLNVLKRDFPEHNFEEKYMGLKSVIDLKEIYGKIEDLLLSYPEDDITLFISPGTPTMQVAWYLCHMNLGLKTSLVQTVSQQKSKKPLAELIQVDIERSLVPTGAIIKEKRAGARDTDGPDYIITDSLQPIYNNALKIAQADNVTVLITGETGTGKEHLAKYIHQNSPRRDKIFVTINCSAFSDSLLESRLFGYMKGSFTDAKTDTIGIFEQANGGSIFLDEIGDISSYMQQSLLRVIQQKGITPIGGTSRKIDVRIITATNKNIPKECTEGNFRWDLFYRLSTVELKLPSLMVRGQNEVKKLLEHFIKIKRKEFGRERKLELDKDAVQVMLDYHWPGNVRELENIVESLYVFNDETANKKSLPPKLFESEENKPLNWEYVEKEHIKKVLFICKGNQKRVAESIGYSINTLRAKLKTYDIIPDDFR
jgi:transcriptional regulator with PAS, ATPase and Fis domain